MRHLLATHGVVVLRELHLEDPDFAALLGALGRLVFTEGERPVPGRVDLNIVTNQGRTRPPRSVFHTDTSYVRRPPAFTALRPVALPEQGGETVFSDQVAAYAALPSVVRHRLRTARVEHRVTGLRATDLSETKSVHPLFRRHPMTHDIALYLSTPERCRWASDEPETRLETLYEHSIHPERTYRHAWKPGDVLIWDNRRTMHRADHSNVVGIRAFHRGLVAGEEPIPAFV